jgi:hypothetical protein
MPTIAAMQNNLRMDPSWLKLGNLDLRASLYKAAGQELLRRARGVARARP